jgi:fumarate hydratase class II
MPAATQVRTRVEKDSMGELEVPIDALYGAQTQRAVNNFQFSGLTMPRAFIRALGLIKAAAAQANTELKLLDPNIAKAIVEAGNQVASGIYDAHFPIDIFQTGSGTSTNMNCNEVISNLIRRNHNLHAHPNDHVNMGQSSNDVIPAAVNLSCVMQARETLIPALQHLMQVIEARAKELNNVVKTGRTHLMDAMPITFGQELTGWAQQLKNNLQHLKNSCEYLEKLPLGGTAVGTGINTHPKFSKIVCKKLSALTDLNLEPMQNFFTGLSFADPAVQFSSQLKGLAITFTKIANDLRLMNSGPLAGFGEISLPAIQPGSSIMPGKVNPVIPEAVLMVGAQVIGNDLTVALGGQSGNFQLNVMLPVIAYNALQSVDLLYNSSKTLADKALVGFKVNIDVINDQLSRNPILVTALNAIIGYERGAEIAKKAYSENRPIKEVAKEMTGMTDAELNRLLDPKHLTEGGINEA